MTATAFPRQFIMNYERRQPDFDEFRVKWMFDFEMIDATTLAANETMNETYEARSADFHKNSLNALDRLLALSLIWINKIKSPAHIVPSTVPFT